MIKNFKADILGIKGDWSKFESVGECITLEADDIRIIQT